MGVQLIGDQIWVNGWHVGDLRADVPATVRGHAEAVLIPTPPLRYVYPQGSTEAARKRTRK